MQPSLNLMGNGMNGKYIKMKEVTQKGEQLKTWIRLGYIVKSGSIYKYTEYYYSTISNV
jgi:hypothetical protein